MHTAESKDAWYRQWDIERARACEEWKVKEETERLKLVEQLRQEVENRRALESRMQQRHRTTLHTTDSHDTKAVASPSEPLKGLGNGYADASNEEQLSLDELRDRLDKVKRWNQDLEGLTRREAKVSSSLHFN